MSRSQAPRRILGIETSTSLCQVAFADGNSLIASAQLPAGEKPTATLIPTLRRVAQEIGWRLRDLELVTVDIGPGSYTGLRVGLTCAKTLAFVAGAPMMPVGSLDAVAQNVFSNEQVLEVGFDAARSQVFAARFQRRDEESTWTATEPVRIVAAAEWARTLDPSALVLGPALIKYRHLIAANLRVAHDSEWWPRAAHVIELGVRQFQSGNVSSYWSIEPIYLRLSAAEEKKFNQRVE